MAAITITAANVKPGAYAKLTFGITTVAVTAGQLLAKNTDDQIVLFDVDILTQSYLGIAMCSASAGQPVVYSDGDDDLTIGATVSQGVVYYASPTAGGISPYSDLSNSQQVIPVGIGKAGNKFTLHPVNRVLKGTLPAA